MTPPNRLKFRFWDASIVGFQYFEFDDFKRRPPEVLAARILYAKEWQQSTGLLDRNQKEIYEGDILRDLRRGGREGWVYWSDHMFCWEPGEEWGWFPSEREIIGNIYEHGELLK